VTRPREGTGIGVVRVERPGSSHFRVIVCCH
jgi:hypothetical protein